MNGPWYLGVDGGGTGCRARLYNREGEALGEGAAGPGSLRLGPEELWRHILQASRQALAGAGLPEAAIGEVHAGLGLAGVIDEQDRQNVLAYPHPFARLALCCDAEAALLGAYDGGDGAILVVGTGSCGMARVGGQHIRIGGWGFPVSDCPSGAWLGLRALQYALAARDGTVPRSLLSDRLLAQFDGNPAALTRWQYTATPGDYARFAREVFELAEQGDRPARGLVRHSAMQLARLGRQLLERGAPGLCIQGSLGRALIPWLPAALRDRLDEPRGDALWGACLLVAPFRQTDPGVTP